MISNCNRKLRGFTLIEIMLSVVIIGMLVFMYVPSMGKVLFRARQLDVLSDLRSHAAIMAQYTADWEDHYPLFTKPYSKVTVSANGVPVIAGLGYFNANNTWHIALADGYYDGKWRTKSFAPPRARPTASTFYWYSGTFMSDPAFWNRYTRTGPEQWRAVGVQEVLYPSQKGLLIDFSNKDRLFLKNNIGRSVSFVDGSARYLTSFEPYYFNGEGNWPGSGLSSGLAVMHTIDGVRGRDTK